MTLASQQRGRLLALALLLLLGGLLLFTRLGSGMMEVYDEGLYGMYAQNALHYDAWLHAVDSKGAFPNGAAKFSKPPLALWLVAASIRALGPSLFALRLPFALASLSIASMAFVWGLRLGGPERGIRLGFGWGLLWLTCHGTYHYGRTATIEPLLIAFLLLALWTHAVALSARGAAQLRWTALSSLGLGAAFLTKQLVCVVAALPMLVVELQRLRTEKRSTWLARNALLFGVPGLAAAAWGLSVWSKVGKPARDVLWQHAVLSRVTGYDGLHHHNYLNRVAEQLDLDAAPFCWQLGVLGMVLFVASRRGRERGTEADAWLLSGALATAWLAFDVGSQSILPWYVMTLLPGLAFGNAWLITQAYESVVQGPAQAPLERLAAGGGAAALLWLVSEAARDFMPAVLAAALAAAALTVCVSPAPCSRRPVGALLFTASLVLLLGAFLRPAYGLTETDPLADLGVALHKLGARNVTLDNRVKTHGYVRATFFGATSVTSSPPWRTANNPAQAHDAYVELRALPLEVKPPPGMTLLRAAGSYAAAGTLTRAPFDRASLQTLLSRGGLTFEAEHMATDRLDTLEERASASGGRVRTIRRGLRTPTTRAALVRGPTIELPAGDYEATFWLAMGCHGFAREVLGSISLSANGRSTKLREHSLACGPATPVDAARYAPITLAFTLRFPGPLQVVLSHKQGMISLDRMVIERRSEAPK